MKLIKPSYQIITSFNGDEILKQIEISARTCYKSEDKIEFKDYYAKSARVLIPKLIERGHEAMLEFGGMITVKFICDRGVSHELVRHRVASFAQESTRYCNYGKDEHIQFIIPNWINIPEGEYIIGWDNFMVECFNQPKFAGGVGDSTWFWSMVLSERDYQKLLKDYKWSPQQARSVLPNSLKTEINVSANIREWRHIFRLRTSNAAHPQMRELMCPLLDEFKNLIPILFDDITF